jgi:hypothetical protein
MCSSSSSSSLGPVSIIAPDAPQPQAYCATLKYFIQHRFSSPVPLIKRKRSLTDAVLISFGSTTESPKALKEPCVTSYVQTAMCYILRTNSHVLYLTHKQPCVISYVQTDMCYILRTNSHVLYLTYKQTWVTSYVQTAMCYILRTNSHVLHLTYKQPCVISYVQTAMYYILRTNSHVLYLTYKLVPLCNL